MPFTKLEAIAHCMKSARRMYPESQFDRSLESLFAMAYSMGQNAEAHTILNNVQEVLTAGKTTADVVESGR